MIIWFEANDKTGTGPYSRSTPNTSARKCYARLANAGSLLWIAEAVGVPTETVRRAFDAAVEAGNYRRACGAIRAIYARLANAGSLLWIAEAVGVPTETVRRAFDAAVEAGNYRRACGAIRAIIPWSEVCSRAKELMR